MQSNLQKTCCLDGHRAQQLLIRSPPFAFHLDRRSSHATKLQKDSSFPLQLVTAGILLILFKKKTSGAILHCVLSNLWADSLSQEVFSLRWLGVDLNQASLRIYTSLSISYNEEEIFARWCDEDHLHTHEERHPHQKQESRQHLSGLQPGPPRGNHPSESHLHKDRGSHGIMADRNPNQGLPEWSTFFQPFSGLSQQSHQPQCLPLTTSHL